MHPACKYDSMREMTPNQAVNFYGSRAALAGVCDVSVQAVGHWVRYNAIPYDKQCQIQVETGNKIRAHKKHAGRRAA